MTIAKNSTWTDLRQLPLVEVPDVPVKYVTVDGPPDDVQIVGDRLQWTLWRAMQPFGYERPVRAVKAVISMPLASYVPGYFDGLVLEAIQRRGQTPRLPSLAFTVQ
jgi:hypothetical protein